LFTPRGMAGTYTMRIGPNILDVFGNQMDQDADAALPPQADDGYTATFTVNGPAAPTFSPRGGGQSPPVHHVQANFGSRRDPACFAPAQVTFTGPAGAIDVTVVPVPFTNNTQFLISFAPQGLAGDYTLTLSPDITDAFGNPLGTSYTDAFSITSFVVT